MTIDKNEQTEEDQWTESYNEDHAHTKQRQNFTARSTTFMKGTNWTERGQRLVT